MEVQAHGGSCPAPGLNGGVQGWQVKPGTARNDLANYVTTRRAAWRTGTAAVSSVVSDVEGYTGKHCKETRMEEYEEMAKLARREIKIHQVASTA